MGRPRKNKTVAPVESTAVTTVEDSKPVTPAPASKHAQEHAEMVKNFQTDNGKKESNNSAENLNKILDSTGVDDIFESAKTDPTVIVAKSSVSESQNNVVEPPLAPLTKQPDDLTIVGGTKTEGKGDEDSPFSLAADDPVARSFAIYDTETDRLVEDVFYANRSTNVVAVFLKDDAGKNVVVRNEQTKEEFPVLLLKKHNIHFKRNIKI